MKVFYLLIFYLFLFISNSTAQNFQTVKRDRMSIYTMTNVGSTYEYIGLQFDSVAAINKDSIFFPYSPINDADRQCIVFDTCWAGQKIMIKENGDNIFFTGGGDSLIIKTKAKLNDQWRWMSRSGMMDITVTGISVEQVLGIIDTVKTMKLRHIISTNVVSFFDSIRISKNFGIIQFYSMKNFPTSKNAILLKGIEKVGGIQNLTIDKIYDFNVGDIFDWAGGYRNGVSYSEENFRDTILEKIINGNIVNYKISSFHTIQENGPNVTDKSLRAYSSIKTISYGLNAYPDTVINSMPLNSFPIQGYYSFNKYTHGNYIPDIDSKVIYSNGYTKSNASPCLIPGADMTERNEYALGLGNIYRSTFFTSSEERKMVYYKKGDKTWGTPIDFEKIITETKSAVDDDFNLILNPNPLKEDGNLTIFSTNKENFTIEIFSLTGELIKSYQTPAMTPVHVNKDDFCSGFYLIKVTGFNGKSLNRKMAVEN